MIKYLFLMLIIFVPMRVILAQSDTDTFRVRIFGGADIIPPTTPTLLTAIPIAPTQIDIAWTASTDNYGVAGYSILRDGNAIATTTSTSYSDTGLAASTTYSYMVRAFDIPYNYSTSSNALATTTPDNPVPPVVTPATPVKPTESTAVRVVIDKLQINTGISTSSFDIKTARPARLELRWGRTGSFELGYVVSSIFLQDHAILLTDLEPGTTYEYEIAGYTPHGNRSVIKVGQFTTKEIISDSLPTNVSRFQAVADQTNVNLAWELPQQENFSHVRIVRSHLGYPKHPQDGAIVYQGGGESAIDEDVLSLYSPVYYTAFVFDTFGNVSSGAIAVAYARDENSSLANDVLNNGREIINKPVLTEEATSTIVRDRITVDMKMPDSSQIFVEQGQKVFSLAESNVSLSSSQSFQISIAKDVIAGNLKSIIVTLLDPTDNRKQYSFLLRINKKGTAYEASVAPLQVVGKSRIMVEIYDYEAMVVASYQSPIVFVADEIVADKVVFPDAILGNVNVLFAILGLIFLVAVIIFVVFRRRAEDKE